MTMFNKRQRSLLDGSPSGSSISVGWKHKNGRWHSLRGSPNCRCVPFGYAIRNASVVSRMLQWPMLGEDNDLF